MNKNFLKNVILERKYYYILISFFFKKQKEKKKRKKDRLWLKKKKKSRWLKVGLSWQVFLVYWAKVTFFIFFASINISTTISLCFVFSFVYF